MNVEYKIIGNTIPFSKSIELYKRSAYIGPTDDGWSEIVKVDEQYYVVQQGLPEYEGHAYRDWETDRKSTRLNSSHRSLSRMPSSA